ncbi:MAG: hypothetical protein KZQ83_06710 [gamma proteobacterium symbiont of Taylorina sp.]|nr:hypothetical protein [gamma proteobacterium symbiont of Taylorina sp.]
MRTPIVALYFYDNREEITQGISDFDGNKQDAGGHKTASMVAVYDRKKKKYLIRLSVLHFTTHYAFVPNQLLTFIHE